MKLLPGDILAWRVDKDASLMDRLIGWGESILRKKGAKGYQYYHVAFISSDVKKMYSSQPPRIDLYPVPDPLPKHVEVYRLQSGTTAVGLMNLYRYADSRVGRWYPFLGVLTAGWLQGNLEFCSQFTQDAFCEYPVCLSDNIRFTSPDDIVTSKFLQRVSQ